MGRGRIDLPRPASLLLVAIPALRPRHEGAHHLARSKSSCRNKTRCAAVFRALTTKAASDEVSESQSVTDSALIPEMADWLGKGVVHRLAGQLVPAGAAYHRGGSGGAGRGGRRPCPRPARLPPVPAAYHRRESGTASQIPPPAAVSHHRRAIRPGRCPHSLSHGNGAFLPGGKQWHGKQRPSRPARDSRSGSPAPPHSIPGAPSRCTRCSSSSRCSASPGC